MGSSVLLLPTSARAVYSVEVRSAEGRWTSIPLTRFPWVLGRAADASTRLEAPGVWDRHLTFDLDPDEGLRVTVQEGALATLGDRTVTCEFLRQGDELVLGGATVRITLTPVARRSLSVWEVGVWVLLGVVALVQVWLAWRLLGGRNPLAGFR